jgi:hypothetical protein
MVYAAKSTKKKKLNVNEIKDEMTQGYCIKKNLAQYERQSMALDVNPWEKHEQRSSLLTAVNVVM